MLFGSVASDVVLADTTFPDTTFQIVKGLTSVKWERIHPNANVTHVVIVRPIKPGPFNFSSSVVQYVASEGSDSTVSNSFNRSNIGRTRDLAQGSAMCRFCPAKVWCL